MTHLFLRDHLRLELAQGATLLGSYDKAHLPVLPGMLQSWDEETEYNLGTWEGNPLPCYAALLTGLHAGTWRSMVPARWRAAARRTPGGRMPSKSRACSAHG